METPGDMECMSPALPRVTVCTEYPHDVTEQNHVTSAARLALPPQLTSIHDVRRDVSPLVASPCLAACSSDSSRLGSPESEINEVCAPVPACCISPAPQLWLPPPPRFPATVSRHGLRPSLTRQFCGAISYRILDPKKITDKTDPRDDCEHLMTSLPQFDNMYQFGHTKVYVVCGMDREDRRVLYRAR